MKIKIIPCLKDNYAYFIGSERGELSSNILIDAPDFQTVDQFIQEQNLNLEHILITHHHWDHTDGILELKEKYKCKVYGAANDDSRIPGIDVRLKNEEVFKIGDIQIRTIQVPGHTHQHVVYYLEEYKVLFSGDTVFSMGCGRLFEGTYQEMFDSLQRIKQLPPQTQMFSGHEYSLKNSQFALSVDAHNEVLKARRQEVLKLQEVNSPTVPTTLELELKINPFLRASTVDEFKNLRQLRDTY